VDILLLEIWEFWTLSAFGSAPECWEKMYAHRFEVVFRLRCGGREIGLAVAETTRWWNGLRAGAAFGDRTVSKLSYISSSGVTTYYRHRLTMPKLQCSGSGLYMYSVCNCTTGGLPYNVYLPPSISMGRKWE
jgi:hypothetical protein